MKQQELMRVLQAPVLSEKSAGLSEREKQFVFRVRRNVRKTQVKEAVELMFDVKVESVRVLNVKGKVKRFGGHLGQRSDWKKAYVKLKPGFNIEISPI
jgi:large subunit ribosomal protein L23